jgi:hypothetical protein
MVYVVFLDAYDYKSVESIWETFDDAAEHIENMEGHNKDEGYPVVLEWKLNSDVHREVLGA